MQISSAPLKPVHPLREWREKNGLTAAEFAGRIGMSRFAVTDWEIYRRFPRPDALRRALAATGGALTADDFMPPEPKTEAAE